MGTEHAGGGGGGGGGGLEENSLQAVNSKNILVIP